MPNRLNGKVAIITGGASGIGQASVRLFTAEGARVVIADILDAEGQALAAELGDAVRFRHTDVSREDDVRAVVDFAVEEFGGLDCMFNNAGFGRLEATIDEIALAEYEALMAVAQRGVFLGLKHAARVMKSRRSGSVVNTASVAGLQTGRGGLLYSTAKAAVIHMTRCAAVELAEFGIRVNCICPGGIVTPIFAKALGLDQAQASRNLGILKEAFQAAQPLRRAGEPLDVANAALWLASGDAAFVTGHALVVDGGMTCGRSLAEAMQSYGALAAAMGVNLNPAS